MQQNRHFSSYRKKISVWKANSWNSIQSERPSWRESGWTLFRQQKTTFSLLSQDVCVLTFWTCIYLYITGELLKEAPFCSLTPVTSYLLWGSIKWKPCKIWCSLTWICSPKNNNTRRLYPPPVSNTKRYRWRQCPKWRPRVTLKQQALQKWLQPGICSSHLTPKYLFESSPFLSPPKKK